LVFQFDFGTPRCINACNYERVEATLALQKKGSRSPNKTRRKRLWDLYWETLTRSSELVRARIWSELTESIHR